MSLLKSGLVTTGLQTNSLIQLEDQLHQQRAKDRASRKEEPVKPTQADQLSKVEQLKQRIARLTQKKMKPQTDPRLELQKSVSSEDAGTQTTQNQYKRGRNNSRDTQHLTSIRAAK